MILSRDSLTQEVSPRTFEERGHTRSRWLRDRFSPSELQAMSDLYRSGATGREVAEKFGVSLCSVKRLLNQHDVCRRPRRIRQ
jgi:hypothetical protein